MNNEKDLKLLAMNIINQLFDLAETPVVKRQAINDEADSFVMRLLQQTPCTASLELIEQMLIEVKSKMPVNTNPHVLGVIIQEIQALKWTMRLIKERQPMT